MVYLFLTASFAFHSSTALSTSITPSTWVLDSGALNHMTTVEQNLEVFQTYVGHETITTANGQHLSISGLGSLEFPTIGKEPPSLSPMFILLHNYLQI